MSCRNVYYAYRLLAIMMLIKSYPCIIYDKMNQANTWIPRMMPHQRPWLVLNLHFWFLAQDTYGREPGVFAHLSVGWFWLGGSNYDALALAKCLQDVKDYNGNMSDVIYDGCYNYSSRHASLIPFYIWKCFIRAFPSHNYIVDQIRFRFINPSVHPHNTTIFMVPAVDLELSLKDSSDLKAKVNSVLFLVQLCKA